LAEIRSRKPDVGLAFGLRGEANEAPVALNIFLKYHAVGASGQSCSSEYSHGASTPKPALRRAAGKRLAYHLQNDTVCNKIGIAYSVPVHCRYVTGRRRTM
jgi:hypothetical protein